MRCHENELGCSLRQPLTFSPAENFYCYAMRIYSFFIARAIKKIVILPLFLCLNYSKTLRIKPNERGKENFFCSNAT